MSQKTLYIVEDDEDFWNKVSTYFSLIEWTEPWLMGVILFHITVFIIICVSRKRSQLQMGLFMSLLLFVYCAQYLNSFAATNWELFATKPYFDANGAFISLIFSGPLLLNASAILVFFCDGTWIIVSESETS